MAHLLRNVLAEAIRNELNDPRIARFTSVTRVDVSPDLSFARVYVSVMDSEAAEKATLKGLAHATGRLREYLRRNVEMRQVPNLQFEADPSLKKSAAVVAELDRIKTELDAREQAAPAAEPPADQPRTE